jgi:phosphatidylglycerophosphatase A
MTSPATRADRTLMILASGFGSGYLRPASGTWGSALAVLLYLPLAGLNTLSLWWAWLLFLVVMFVLGVWVSGAGERVTGEKDSHDIVFDEFAGQWVALSFLPVSSAVGLGTLWGWSPQHIVVLGASFFLFRVFDVWKPWPIHQLQGLRGGFGVMIDDILAGLWACGLLHLALWGLRVMG